MSVLEEVEELRKNQNKVESSDSVQTPKEDVSTRETTNATVADNDAIVPTTTAEQGLNKAISKAVESAEDIKSLTRDLTYLAGASALQRDDDFTSAYKSAQGKQLIQDLEAEGKRQAIVDASKKQEAKNLRAQAYYEGFKPVFELLNIDKAFGLIPMIITTVLLMIPFLVVSLVRFVVNSVNSIFTAVSKFTKPAFWICTIVITLVITALVILAALYGIDRVFGTQIVLR